MTVTAVYILGCNSLFQNGFILRVCLCYVWHRYLQQVVALFSPSFWKFFLRMHTQTATAISASLLAAKSTFMQHVSREELKKFPSDKRAVMTKINSAPDFWSRVTHTVDIDLNPCNIDQKVVFRFIDPVWAWVVAARRLDPTLLQWEPKIQFRSDDRNRVYGGGVQYGEAFAEACRSCPEGTYPMCLSLHWDGATSHGVSATPIAVGVTNINGQSPDAHSCLGYFPIPDGMGKTWHETGVEVKFFLRQQCVNAILAVLEHSAHRGVRVNLLDNHGNETERVLYPRLLAMNLDQPEAQLYFGHQNKTSCSKCKWRKGRSAHRRAPILTGSTINLLYNIALDTTTSIANQKTAQEKLQQYGFNWKRRCLLTTAVAKLLIKVPGKDEVFPCVDQRDRLHALMGFICRTVTDTLNLLPFSNATKVLLDQRLTEVAASGGLRDPVSKRSYRIQTSMFHDANVTTVNRVSTLFFLPHVFGHLARLLPPADRADVLGLVAQAQMLIIACRGKRSYTENELEIIYDEGYVIFFGHAEAIHKRYFDRKFAEKMKKHANNPNKHRPPKPYKRKTRYTSTPVFKPAVTPAFRTFVTPIFKTRNYCNTHFENCCNTHFQNYCNTHF